jgi:hypothetical protein
MHCPCHFSHTQCKFLLWHYECACTTRVSWMCCISLLYLCCCSCFLMLEDEFCNTSPLVAWLYWDLAALDLISMLILAFLEGTRKCSVLKCTSLLVFPCSFWVLLVGFSKLAACVIQYFLQSLFLSMIILYPGSYIEQSCGTVACRLAEVFSALGVLAIHFLSYASLLIQKLWLSTWEGGLHLVITTGKWDLWWETRFRVPGLRMMLKTFRCIHSGDLPHSILLVPERPDVLSTGLYTKKCLILRSTMMSCISTLCHESQPTSS